MHHHRRTQKKTSRLLRPNRHILCRHWAEKSLEARQQLAFRAIQGVLHLREKYPVDKINWACQQALTMGSVRYHTIALLCQEKPEFGTQLTLLQEHELIRSPQEYQLYTEGIDTT